jgi:hypothetical protein
VDYRLTQLVIAGIGQSIIKGYTKDNYNCEKGHGDKKGAADKKRDNDENTNDEKRNV